MEVTTVNCASCGAPIKIPPDLESFNCSFCGSALVVQRGEGYVALKLAEQVSKSIQDSGKQTQSTIREGTQVTQAELKRLQITQEISSLQIQLANLQSEIRSLQRGKADRRTKKQLKELVGQEHDLHQRIRGLQGSLAPAYSAQSTAVSRLAESLAHTRAGAPAAAKPGFFARPSGKGCLTGFLVLMAGTLLCGIPAQALDQAVFDIPMGSSGTTTTTTGPFFMVAIVFICVALAIGFAYGYNPKAKAWQTAGNWIRQRLGRPKKEAAAPPPATPPEPVEASASGEKKEAA